MEESLKAALELRRDGNLLDSSQLLQKLVLQHPEHAMLHYELAWSFDILAKPEKAISLYRQAIELDLPKATAVNAYAQLGSLYRLKGQFTESEKILMEGMLRFWDVGLLKAFYAFTMYDLGNSGEAMRWMTDALLDSSTDSEIFLNQRVISYLGSNLDVQHIMKNFVANVPNEVEHSEDGKPIVEKVETVLKVFEPTYFHGGWVFEFDRYDLHFTDSNNEIRRAAIAAFAIMIGIWETGSAQAFVPQHERKYSGDYNPFEPHFELNGYISAFYSNFNILQQEFPIMTAYTVDCLGAIDERSKLGLDQEFPEIDTILFVKFRQEILLPNRQLKKKLPPFDDFLKEIGWDLS